MPLKGRENERIAVCYVLTRDIAPLSPSQRSDLELSAAVIMDHHYWQPPLLATTVAPRAIIVPLLGSARSRLAQSPPSTSPSRSQSARLASPCLSSCL